MSAAHLSVLRCVSIAMAGIIISSANDPAEAIRLNNVLNKYISQFESRYGNVPI
jgi:hypothetical protein